MNQTFDFHRWQMLVASHWAEHRKRYLLALLAVGGLLAGWYGFLLMLDHFGPLNLFIQYATYYCGLFLVGCFYASTLFSELGSKSRATQYLSVPASHLEKLLCGILFGVVLFFIAFTIVFYIVDIPMVSLANHIIAGEHQHWPNTFQPIGSVGVLNIWNTGWAPVIDRKYHFFLCGYFAIQSAFLLGSVYFTRWSFIKTVVSLLVFWVAFILYAQKGIAEHLPDGWHPYDLVRWTNNTENIAAASVVSLPGTMEKIFIFLMQCSLPPVFWIITYFRLKEKEV
ncbi:MAG TPA: hypothetical protein VIM64_21435 [Puia sp.]